MLISLTGITLVAGALLGAVHAVTEEPIAQAAAKARIEAMESILPAFDNNIVSTVENIDGLDVYTAENGGEMVGKAVETYSDAGFGGRISLLVGFAADGTLTGYSVLSHAETPGLGAKMGEWFSAEGTSHNVIGTGAPIAVKADGGEIDAITGATITSRAFAEAVNRAREVFEKSSAK